MTRINHLFAAAGLVIGFASISGLASISVAEARIVRPVADATAYIAVSPSARPSTLQETPLSTSFAPERSTTTGGPAGGLSSGN